MKHCIVLAKDLYGNVAVRHLGAIVEVLYLWRHVTLQYHRGGKHGGLKCAAPNRGKTSLSFENRVTVRDPIEWLQVSLKMLSYSIFASHYGFLCLQNIPSELLGRS
jgi:hypothetical protein